LPPQLSHRGISWGGKKHKIQEKEKEKKEKKKKWERKKHTGEVVPDLLVLPFSQSELYTAMATVR
jgi:DNA recombination-dependent growth factor C